MRYDDIEERNGEFKKVLKGYLEEKFGGYTKKLIFCDMFTALVVFSAISHFLYWISPASPILFWFNDELLVPRQFNCSFTTSSTSGKFNTYSTICTNNMFLEEREAIFYIFITLMVAALLTIIQVCIWTSLLFDCQKW